MDPLREALADVSHDIWSHWMRWQFTQGTHHPDGSFTLPADKVARWQRQTETDYAALTEGEKESDREQASKILAVLWRHSLPPVPTIVTDMGED